jgi:hypothetical protein
VLAVIAGLLAAGCSTHPSGQATSTVPTTGGPTSSSAPSTSGTTTPVAQARCTAAALAVSVAGTQGAAGTFEVTLRLRNISTGTCGLQGYPGAQLYDAGGAALATTVVPGGSYSFTNFAPAPLSLTAGASAFVNMAYSDVPTGNAPCPTAASMWLTPPGDTDHVVLSEQFVVCNGRLTVSPVFGPGSPETRTTAPPQP